MVLGHTDCCYQDADSNRSYGVQSKVSCSSYTCNIPSLISFLLNSNCIFWPSFFRVNTIIECTGLASYHGFLPTLTRKCIQAMTGKAVVYYMVLSSYVYCKGPTIKGENVKALAIEYC